MVMSSSNKQYGCLLQLQQRYPHELQVVSSVNQNDGYNAVKLILKRLSKQKLTVDTGSDKVKWKPECMLEVKAESEVHKIYLKI